MILIRGDGLGFITVRKNGDCPFFSYEFGDWEYGASYLKEWLPHYKAAWEEAPEYLEI